MKKCIYCETEKPEDEFSLEHAIPQFLGGAQASDQFKTRDVCRKCNSNLGLFVDASFQKQFLVFNQLNLAAQGLFDPQAPTPLPLKSMGLSTFSTPGILDTEVCEHWIGPLGETIFWVRPDDEKTYWYSGGNPRLVKQKSSKAYFFASVHSQSHPEITFLSFTSAFKGRKVSKILGTKSDLESPSQIGFSEPDDLDETRIEFFQNQINKGEMLHNEVPFNLAFDQRFMAKLALGIAHSLFGDSIKDTTYTAELIKGLWHRTGDPVPEILGKSELDGGDPQLLNNLGIPCGVVISVMPIDDSISIILNINQKMHWVVKCAQKSDLSEDDLKAIHDHGITVVLFDSIGKGITLPLVDFLAHQTGDIPNPEISQIEAKMNQHKDFFENLDEIL